MGRVVHAFSKIIRTIRFCKHQTLSKAPQICEMMWMSYGKSSFSPPILNTGPTGANSPLLFQPNIVWTLVYAEELWLYSSELCLSSDLCVCVADMNDGFYCGVFLLVLLVITVLSAFSLSSGKNKVAWYYIVLRKEILIISPTKNTAHQFKQASHYHWFQIKTSLEEFHFCLPVRLEMYFYLKCGQRQLPLCQTRFSPIRRQQVTWASFCIFRLMKKLWQSKQMSSLFLFSLSLKSVCEQGCFVSPFTELCYHWSVSTLRWPVARALAMSSVGHLHFNVSTTRRPQVSKFSRLSQEGMQSDVDLPLVCCSSRGEGSWRLVLFRCFEDWDCFQYHHTEEEI